jgi:hypothetical protein
MSLKKYLFVFPLVCIVILAYWRYTYMLNPNLSGDPFLIKIMKGNGLANQSYDANSLTNIKSIILCWLLFFTANTIFFRTAFHSRKKANSIIALFLLISFVSALFFAADAFWFKSVALFNLASILKNFILTPMFTAIAYIMIAYFHWFDSSD